MEESQTSKNEMVATGATVKGAGTTASPPAAASVSFRFTPPKEFDGKQANFEEFSFKLTAIVDQSVNRRISFERDQRNRLH